MVVSVGIVGLSEGNGHPYSFSAIINGYDRGVFAKCGWPGIFDYLESKDSTELGIEGLEVSSVWTQDIDESRKIAAATRIANVCESLEEMCEKVDAVIIARDDWECHFEMALLFLQQGKYVFVDKPLSLNLDELKVLVPYIEDAKLMSCAALRYAAEFDVYRAKCREKRPKFISGTIVADWQKYGVHLMDGIFSGIDFNVESVFASGDLLKIAVLNCTDETKININCLGTTQKTFNITSYFNDEKLSCEMSDNFTAFKRTLSHFKSMIVEKKIPISPSLTVNIMKTLIAGDISSKENRLVHLNEIDI